MKQLKSLNKYIWRYKWHLLLGIVFIVISDLYGVWSQIYVRDGVNAIDAFSTEFKNGQVSQQVEHDFLAIIVYCILLFAGFNLIKGFFLFCQRQTIIVMSRRIEYDLKNDIYKKYQELPLSFYQKNSTGDIMNRISEDVGKVRMYLGPGIMYTINLVVLLVITIGQMLKVNAELTLYVLMPLPLMGWLVFKISNIINKKSSRLQILQSDLSTRTQEDFTSIRLIKTFGRLKQVNTQFNSKADAYQNAATSLLRTDAAFTPIMTVLVGLSSVLAICMGGIFYIQGKIEIGNIPEFLMYVNMLTWPFASVGWISSLIQRAAVSQQRIDAFMTEISQDIKQKNITQFPATFEHISFKNVSFGYSSKQPALKDISFNLQRGKVLGIIGKTGSGKTTLANLLNGSYSHYTGTIHIGEQELRNMSLFELRNILACVPQEAYLFSDTIANNIAFGSPQKETLPDIVSYYAKQAVVHDNIMHFEKKYDTVVGERGITLSGGQKQRVTIARALIREPQILIFDDCMSAVDAETEKKILQNLLTQMQGKTTLLISHRVSTVMHANEIIVLDEGKITERGTHASLIEQNGLYKKLFDKQTKLSV